VRTLDLYVRSLVGPGNHDEQDDLLAAAARLERAGVVEETRVTVLGDKLCRCGRCATTRPTRERLREIDRWRSWAEAVGATLLLDEHPVRSSITGQEFRYVVPPAVTLVCRVDGEIEAVYPSRRDGSVTTPADYLDAAAVDAEETASRLDIGTVPE